ncbi:reverse transcriptase domain-containing protein [Trichonephila clavipes]|nr:reverse transcriptase domain-containing protein [Trichonephila clavipes]
MRSEFKPRTITCKNKRGELVSEPHEVTKVWKDYFQDLLEGRDEPIVFQNVHTEKDIIADEENPPPSITEPYTDKVIGNYQCGFRPQRSTIHQIHTLRQTLEKTKEYNIKTFNLFVDFKPAYDSINRDKMIEAMTELKIPKKLINLTKATLKNVRCRIKLQKYLSESFTTERGLRQGDSLACLLFNLLLEECIRESSLDRSGTLWNRSLQILSYANDIDIIGRSEKAVKEDFQALEISATNMGLTINEDKTKFMETLPSSVNNTSLCKRSFF